MLYNTGIRTKQRPKTTNLSNRNKTTRQYDKKKKRPIAKVSTSKPNVKNLPIAQPLSHSKHREETSIAQSLTQLEQLISHFSFSVYHISKSFKLATTYKLHLGKKHNKATIKKERMYLSQPPTNTN